MAAEARAESPAPAPPSPPLPVPGKRVVPEGGGEERPEPKRLRACVAALDGVPCAPSVGREGDVSSFSFQHARGGFVALETTPKFGSFNPPAAAEQAALDPTPPPLAGEDSQEEAASARAEGEGKYGNSQVRS